MKRFKIKHFIQHFFLLKRAFRLVWQSGPKWTIASVILIIAQGALPLLSLYLMKLMVDAVTRGISAPDKGEAFGHVASLIALAGGVALFSAFFGSLAELVREAQSQVVTDQMHDILHAKSIEVDLEYYESSQYYDTLRRAQQEVPFRPTRIVSGLMQVGQSAVSLLAIAGLLFKFHWSFAAILFVSAVPGFIVRLRYSSKMYRFERERTPTERRAWYFNWMLTRDMHAKEIRLFDLGSLFLERFRNLRKQLRREKRL